jgi:hypothetical protein
VAVCGSPAGGFTLNGLLLPDCVKHFSPSLVFSRRPFLFRPIELLGFAELGLQGLAGRIGPGRAPGAKECYQAKEAPPRSHIDPERFLTSAGVKKQFFLFNISPIK